MFSTDAFRISFRYIHVDLLSKEEPKRRSIGPMIIDAKNTGQIKPYRGRLCYPSDELYGLYHILDFCEQITVCVVEDHEGNEVSKGYAFFTPDNESKSVRPEQKQFNKAEGRRISLRRAKQVMRDKLGVPFWDCKFFMYHKDLKDYLNGKSA